MELTLATRRSALALAQTRAFAEKLAKKNAGLVVRELQLVTEGDRTQASNQSLVEIGGKGLFIKELEEALLDGRADFAVHSIKDVPGVLAPNLIVACVPHREDPRDVIVTKSGGGLASLPNGARVGTSSLRRAIAIKEARPDVVIEPIRGNVDTRLRKVSDGQFDAIVLALAGLKRLGLEGRASEILSPEVSLPAVGQGALGIECREDDDKTRAVLATMRDDETSICVAAERAVMIAVDGNCRAPVAAFALRDGDALRLRAFLGDADGTNLRRDERRIAWPSSIDDAIALGRELGASLKGAKSGS